MKAAVDSIGRLPATFNLGLGANMIVEASGVAETPSLSDISVTVVVEEISSGELLSFCWSCGSDYRSFPIEFSGEKSPSGSDSSKSVFAGGDITCSLG